MNALKNLNQAFQGWDWASPGSTPFALARHLSLPMPVLLTGARFPRRVCNSAVCLSLAV